DRPVLPPRPADGPPRPDADDRLGADGPGHPADVPGRREPVHGALSPARLRRVPGQTLPGRGERAMSVDFGFGLITCQRYPGDPRSDTELYRQALALAEDADAFGLDSVWVSEHHFVADAYLPSLR